MSIETAKIVECAEALRKALAELQDAQEEDMHGNGKAEWIATCVDRAAELIQFALDRMPRDV